MPTGVAHWRYQTIPDFVWTSKTFFLSGNESDNFTLSISPLVTVLTGVGACWVESTKVVFKSLRNTAWCNGLVNYKADKHSLKLHQTAIQGKWYNFSIHGTDLKAIYVKIRPTRYSTLRIEVVWDYSAVSRVATLMTWNASSAVISMTAI